MNNVLVITLIASLSLVSSVAWSELSERAESTDAPQETKRSLGILIFGDFGTGKPTQASVASEMTSFCRQQISKCDFAVTTGDNIYERGIENKTDGTPDYEVVRDRFVTIYEPLNIPIYLTLGNHDVNQKKGGSNVVNNLIKNQVEFSRHNLNPVRANDERSSFRLWNMPASYYAVTELKDTRLYSIDSNIFPSASYDRKVGRSEPSAQRDWLTEELSKHTGKGWKIVFGHHPLVTHGSHGAKMKEITKRETFRESLLDVLCTRKVDFYLTGHDHHLELDKFDCGDGHMVVQILSGAAGQVNKFEPDTVERGDQNLLWANGIYYKDNPEDFSKSRVSGFAYLNLKDSVHATINLVISKNSLTPDMKHGSFSFRKKGRSTNASIEAKPKKPVWAPAVVGESDVTGK